MTGLLMLAFAAAGCVKDDYGLAPSVVEGRPVTVTLKCDLGRTSDITVTRADNTYSGLSTYTLFVYDAAGTTCQQVLTLENGSIKLLGTDTSLPNRERLYQLTFKTTSGEKKLLGVANYATGNSGFWSGFSELKKRAADGTLSFDALRQSLISLRDGLIGADGLIMPSITASSQMLISGWNEGVVFATDGSVANCGTYGDQARKIVLKMDRAMARITFKLPSVSTVNSAGHTVTFVPSTYRVYNVPKKAPLIKPVSGASGASLYTTPDSLADEEFLTSATANVPAVSGGSYTFTFYMPENVQAEVAKNADGGNMSYVDREKWTGDPGSLPQNKKWTNAPKHSTFVVVSGVYTEMNGTTPIYTGNVNYTVHLGDFSTGKGATGSYGNFSVERNYSYTYNMTVEGVKNIKVEATKGDENQPGAEGSIYDAQTCVYNYLLDSHFEQGYMQYDLSAIAGAVAADLANVQNPTEEEIDNSISSKLFLEVQSPFMPQASHRGSLEPYKTYADAAEGRVSMTPEEAKKNAVKDFDYKWVEFWPQDTTVISAYPGTPTWSHAYIKDVTTAAGDADRLIDAYDLIVAMGKVVKKIYLNGGSNTISTDELEEESGITITQDQGKYVARFTAFVNEYYYYKNPLTGAALTSWGPLVNKSAREMIVAMSTDVSADGNSSYSQIHSYISQLSMQTFYNPSAGINAFGLETYNETPLTMGFTTNVADGYLDDSDGRRNQVRLLLDYNNNVTSVPSNVSWNKYISMNDNGWVSTTPAERAKRKLPDAYVENNAAYACLSRNRDLNGNGKIDDNEVRWYLASLNEYIRIGIGSGVLSNSAQLYMGDKMAMTHASYPNSYIGDGALYYTSSKKDKRVFWAVERGAYGNNDSYNHLPIRCIRILPTGDLTKVSGVVAASTVEKRKDNRSDLTVLKFKGRVVDELYRQRVDDALDKHNEDDDANAYYDGIYVSGSYLNDSYMLGDIIGYEGTVPNTHTFDGTMINPCYDQYGAGWRVPNLVELSAMNAVGELNNSGDHYITACCTQFSNLKVRYGFARSSLIYCPGSNSSDVGYSYNSGSRTGFYIRCVKDVEAGYNFDTQSTPAN
ncbi:MAG TPA: DUF4906 domain-containing protein [Candidatus Alistipes faecavium]|nr:DUF4906 domain-containing protein [Candidatus Alistipes faecavium]